MPEKTMRCKNCGWENPEGSLRCAKCNAALADSAPVNSFQESNPASTPGANLKGTVKEGQIFGSQVRQSAGPDQGHTCPKCGYPVARNVEMCPNCGTSLSETPNGGRTVTSGYAPSPGASAHLGTVNPWLSPQSGTFCTLKPLPWQGEGVAHSPVSYSGERIVLNRANTDPNNQSITSKEQAELVYENGSWYLEDKSAQETTFIHAGRRVKLETGDIIILGNRRFEFKGK